MGANKFKIAIVGHVDHGKSTLIGRLLYDTKSIAVDKINEVEQICKRLGEDFNFAYLLDHLQEEREQGITIDTTQTFFRTAMREYVIIDAPGHVEFIKNMITGVSQAEAAILIIDAIEGCKEQTKRHAFILSMLGIKEVIVVVNKMDSISYDQEIYLQVKKEIEDFLASIKIEANEYIPISALEGDNIVLQSENMSWYKGKTVLQYLESIKSIHSYENEIALLPVQDVYKISDKRIAVGRIETGTLKVNDEMSVLPRNTTLKVKSIEKYLEDVDTSYAGECIGITTVEPNFLERGDIICSKHNIFDVTDTFKVNLLLIAPKSLKVGEKVTLQCTTQESSAEIIQIHKKVESSSLLEIKDNLSIIKPLEVCNITVKTKKPIVISTDSQFYMLNRVVMLRENEICAGGLIMK